MGLNLLPAQGTFPVFDCVGGAPAGSSSRAPVAAGSARAGSAHPWSRSRPRVPVRLDPAGAGLWRSSNPRSEASVIPAGAVWIQAAAADVFDPRPAG